MSPQFIQKMLAKFKCNSCKAQAAKKRKFCLYHLEIAKRTWHRRVARRLATGQCINCYRRHLPGEQRCAGCKEKNRVKCRVWSKAHYAIRVTAYVIKGLCPLCPQHLPAGAGGYYCDECAFQNRLRRERRKMAKLMYSELLNVAGFATA